MDFGIYTSRILTLEEAEKGTKRFSKKQKRTRFQNKKGNMVMVTIDKSEFGELDDKHCILPDGIISLPYGHLAMSHVETFKESLFPLNPEKIITHHKRNLLRFEQGILESNERMRIINNVLLQQPVFYKRGSLKRSQFQITASTREFILLGLWQKL